LSDKTIRPVKMLLINGDAFFEAFFSLHNTASTLNKQQRIDVAK